MKRLCRLLGVSRNGFYGYLRRQDRKFDPEHEEKLAWVKDVAEASDPTALDAWPRRCGHWAMEGQDGIRPAA